MTRLLLVLGRRSGTSLFTGILGQLGFHVPRPEVKADDTNPRGFSEPRWVVDFHTRLLRERRVTVFDSRPAAWESTAQAVADGEAFEELRSWLGVQFVGTENVVVKDPRLSWFLPLWLRCADDLEIATSFATVLRPPPEVVWSSRSSYGWQNDASLAAAWLNVTLSSERETRGAKRAFVRYDDLLADWSREISRIGELLDLPWLVGVERSRHPEVDAFVEPALRRSAVGWDDVSVPAPLQSLADEVWGQMSRLAEPGGDDGATYGALESARTAYAELYADAEAIAQSSLRAQAPRRPGALASPPKPGRSRLRRRPRLLRTLARLTPARQRRRLGLVASLGAGGLAALPVRVALLVPLRYRERLPVPVVRIGVRLVRALRR